VATLVPRLPWQLHQAALLHRRPRPPLLRASQLTPLRTLPLLLLRHIRGRLPALRLLVTLPLPSLRYLALCRLLRRRLLAMRAALRPRPPPLLRRAHAAPAVRMRPRPRPWLRLVWTTMCALRPRMRRRALHAQSRSSTRLVPMCCLVL
jgi:hypothetical protein